MGGGGCLETRNGKWNEKERKDIGFIKGGRAIERSWPINGPIKWLEQKIEKLMVGIGNGGFAADGRSGRRTVGMQNFTGCENFAPCKNFAGYEISKQKTTP